jgi:hypothetical protein
VCVTSAIDYRTSESVFTSENSSESSSVSGSLHFH